MSFVYILLCNDNSYYIGSTINLDKRLHEHSSGIGAIYTAKRLPVKLVHFESYTNIKDAFEREKQLKKWSRAKKELLINGDLDKLSDLSQAYRDRK